ncbi:MAG TPA: MBL fold metallo-hydrolase, partial [Vicinamibacterales bacterium]|nr:MBL fold metallo-hydrolase [Vicinamibacterales bacterium]
GMQANGIRWPDVRHILLTHIHLDHAGATGTIVREHPHIKVFVHERGAKHMVDPTRLIESATRIYRDRMDELWGEFAPVPTGNLVSLTGGERVEAGGRMFDVAYTPGHASHHVSYFDGSSGVAFVGDMAGVCINNGYVLPPTPPPDIDIEAWGQSVDRILAWSPATLFLTHFGPVATVRPHLATLLENLKTTSGIALELLNGPGADEERGAAFAERLRGLLRRQMTESDVTTYIVAAAYEHLFNGLARYWRKKGTVT